MVESEDEFADLEALAVTARDTPSPARHLDLADACRLRAIIVAGLFCPDTRLVQQIGRAVSDVVRATEPAELTLPIELWVRDQVYAAATSSMSIATQLDDLHQLVRLAQTGDQRARNDLFTRLSPLVTGIVQRDFRFASERDDVVQTALTQLFVQLPSYGWRAPFFSWVRIVVGHSCYRSYRDLQRVPMPASWSQHDRATYSRVSVIAGHRIEVLAHLEHLTEHQRNLLIERHFCGMSLREMAELDVARRERPGPAEPADERRIRRETHDAREAVRAIAARTAPRR